VNKTLMIATALMTGAFSSAAAQPSPSVLQSLPAEVQKNIEGVRFACRGHLVAEGEPDWHPDGGLRLLTVSGLKAVMVNNRELCGDQCFKGANCSNRDSYPVAIYVRSGNAWKKALSTEAVGVVFLSTDLNDKFKTLVLSVYSGNKDCPTRDLLVREGKESYVIPAHKQSCDAIVR
jgi:hypothetical protein